MRILYYVVIDDEDDPNNWDYEEYYLQPSSPCINAGTSEGAPKSDIDNNPRPIGSGYDMGAYEFLECSLNSLITVYKDGDGDNCGDPNIVAFVCNNLSGYVENKDDCNDNDPNINPSALEICDDKDNNCSGKIDDGLPVYIYYSDADRDGYGDPNNFIERFCQPIGYLLDNTDCMDNNPLINPGAIEGCDGIDNNCDDKVDVEGSQGCTIYYKDEDHDEQGVDIDSRCLCSPDYLNKYTAIYSGDPDDLDPNIKGIILKGNMSLPADWSMVSIPLTQDDAFVSSMFHDAVVVYGYEKGKGYVRVKKEENMEVGVGYWILLNEAKTYSMTGEIIDDYNLSVQDGWYMIGGCTYPAQASGYNYNICVIYGYEQESGYQQVLGTEDLEPGNGYWILFEDVIGQANLTVQEIME